MRRIRAEGGAVWESKVGYSRVVRAGERVFVTGTTSYDAGKDPVRGSAYEQSIQIFRNIDAALARVGATLDDVTRTRIYVTDIDADWRDVARAHAEVLGHIRPATTMVQVSKLIDAWMRVEIEVDAIIGVEPPMLSPASLRTASALEIAPLVEAVSLPPTQAQSCLVAEVDGVIVGCVGWSRTGPRTYLQSLAVLPAHRKKGIATLLMDTALLRIGPAEVWLLTEDAPVFFERFGFQVVPGRPDWVDAPNACADAQAMFRKSSS